MQFTQRFLVVFITFIIGTYVIFAGNKPLAETNSLKSPRITLSNDTVIPPPIDSISRKDSLTTDTLTLNSDTTKGKAMLDAPVAYKATDSIVMTAGNMVYLYGEADVKYQRMQLQADMVRINMDSSSVYATFSKDTLGQEFGYPIFVEGEQNIESKVMRYNFKSKKGFSKETLTQQGEGYVTAVTTKKMDNDILNMAGGRYTTCDNHDHPHYYIYMTKAKVRPQKDIVTGPAYLVFEDVPIPILGLPFAFFPFTSSYSSGIIMPTYADERNRGFGLRDGGYYFALSDYVDLALTGEIYTKGSWGLGAQSNYMKRYKFRGSLDARYTVTTEGDKAIEGDYRKSTDFRFNWNHSQDPKANPYQTFSASVQFSTSNYGRNNPHEQYGYGGTSNNKSSSISLSRRFPNSPFSISATMNINQRSQDSTLSVTLPNMTITMNRIYPFKRKQAIGSTRWYEKISLSYNAELRNSIDTKENLILKSNLIKDWKNGMQHRAAISSTFNLFNYINLTPSVNYTERWVTRKIEKGFDQTQNRVAPVDTTYGFYRLYDYNASVSASTTIYGFFKPLPFLGKKVEMIRHRMEPNISLSIAPDFRDPKYGYYTTLVYQAPNNPDSLIYHEYSPYEGGIYSAPGGGRQGNLSFGLKNNVEMKMAAVDSTGQQKKVSLIDDLSFNWGYNFAADSFKWGENIATNLRLKLGTYTLNLNMQMDPYTYKNIGTAEKPVGRRVDKLRIASGKGMARLRSTGTSFSYTFNNDTFKKLFKKGEDSGSAKKEETTDMNLDDENMDQLEDNLQGKPMRQDKQNDRAEIDEDGYAAHSIPWSFTFNYSLNMNYDMAKFNPKTNEYKYMFTHGLSFSGNIQPTKNWQVNFSATYDFREKKIAHMNMNISRNLHCFSMTASVIPIGPYKSYMFSVAVNSAMLKDLKYQQSSSALDNRYMNWY